MERSPHVQQLLDRLADERRQAWQLLAALAFVLFVLLLAIRQIVID